QNSRGAVVRLRRSSSERGEATYGCAAPAVWNAGTTERLRSGNQARCDDERGTQCDNARGKGPTSRSGSTRMAAPKATTSGPSQRPELDVGPLEEWAALLSARRKQRSLATNRQRFSPSRKVQSKAGTRQGSAAGVSCCVC